ncbi:MAG: hypothetical protein IH991_21985 [Planctomycetes bacterium]|nr:hypothetical protein [Planctomycetota bacterium]
MAEENEPLSANLADPPQITQLDRSSAPFIGRWNQLVSTTNWEKGHIICEWRDSLIGAGAPVAEYADEAWSRLVGGVTPQHVGRLRRVSQRFAQTCDDYEGIFWSHFHAALDWDDAEMWLEGAVQNRWSVSQMRQKRWETLGGAEETKPSDADVIVADLDEDISPQDSPDAFPTTITGTFEEVVTAPREETQQRARGSDLGEISQDPELGPSIFSADRAEETIPFVRPFENLAELPEDLADAFENFKLAILRHKSEDWKQISREDVLASLDALKELAMAPSVEEAPF